MSGDYFNICIYIDVVFKLYLRLYFKLFILNYFFKCPTGETPRKTRGSLIGMVNEREFGVSSLEANITDSEEEGGNTLQARLDNIPPSVGE